MHVLASSGGVKSLVKNTVRMVLGILILLAPSPAVPSAQDFEFVARHLLAAGQPSPIGMELEAAIVYQGKIYWGYGDMA